MTAFTLARHEHFLAWLGCAHKIIQQTQASSCSPTIRYERPLRVSFEKAHPLSCQDFAHEPASLTLPVEAEKLHRLREQLFFIVFWLLCSSALDRASHLYELNVARARMKNRLICFLLAVLEFIGGTIVKHSLKPIRVDSRMNLFSSGCAGIHIGPS